MLIGKGFVLNRTRALEQQMVEMETYLNKIALNLIRIRFGSGTDGDRGENMDGEWQVVGDTGAANVEFTVTHGVGAVPIGFLVMKIDKGGVIYDSGTAWTATSLFLKCSAANAAVSLFVVK